MHRESCPQNCRVFAAAGSLRNIDLEGPQKKSEAALLDKTERPESQTPKAVSSLVALSRY
jgi:hypothetical protein